MIKELVSENFTVSQRPQNIKSIKLHLNIDRDAGRDLIFFENQVEELIDILSKAKEMILDVVE